MGFHKFGDWHLDIDKADAAAEIALNQPKQEKKKKGYKYQIIKHKNLKVQDTKIQYQMRIWKSRFVFHPIESIK